MDVRFVAGGLLEPGPATVWLRMRQPLVAGEEPSPLQRVLVTADVGNGVSASLDSAATSSSTSTSPSTWSGCRRGSGSASMPGTLPQPSGNGTAESVLSDSDGRIGRALQTLLIAQR